MDARERVRDVEGLHLSEYESLGELRLLKERL
jgi:hypothetical protein